MAEAVAETTPDLTALTVQLLSAYVANNKVENGELAGLIQSTRRALAADDAPVAQEAEPEPEFTRATTIRKSLADPGRFVSMIDGKSYRTLTRHLKTHGLTPAEYRARYKLPADYPTIAPGYSEQRREVARRLGLGRKPASKSATAEEPTEATAAAKPAAAKRPRRAKGAATEAADAGAAPKRRGRRPRDEAAGAATTSEAVLDGTAKPRRGRRPRAGDAAEA